MWWAGRGGWSRKGVLQGARETCSFPVGLSGACNGSDCTDLELQQAELAKDFDGQEFRVLFFSFFSLIAGVKFSASPSQPGGELVASGKLQGAKTVKQRHRIRETEGMKSVSQKTSFYSATICVGGRRELEGGGMGRCGENSWGGINRCDELWRRK